MSIFFTDSAYVITVMHAIALGVQHTGIHKMANADVILKIIGLRYTFTADFIKVKSHRELPSAKDDYDMWTILGNTAADKAATLALGRMPNLIQSWVTNLVAEENKSKEQLTCVRVYIADLNKTRLKILQDENKVPKRTAEHVSSGSVPRLRYSI